MRRGLKSINNRPIESRVASANPPNVAIWLRVQGPAPSKRGRADSSGDRTGGTDATRLNIVPSAQPDTSTFDEDAGFRKFNVAFEGLLGAVHPPNPIRNLDNSLTSDQQSVLGGRDVEVTDPALLALGKNDVNVFRVTTTGELSWGTVAVETPDGGGEYAIWAAWPSQPIGSWDSATTHPGNLCEVGFQDGLDLSGIAMNLSGGVSCGQ